MNSGRIVAGILVVLLLACVACVPPAGEGQPSLVEQAAWEATRIVQEAQATALVLQAQAQATQIASRAQSMLDTPLPATLVVEVPAGEQKASIAAETLENRTEPEESQQVEIVRVGFAGEGGFIIIQFKAPAEVAERWWQGDFLVVDEETETEYKEVPVMPKIGPLISKPKLAGQVGYVMLVNTPPGLSTGARVTVMLGDYRFEHVVVE